MTLRQCWICGEWSDYFASDGYRYMMCARQLNFSLKDAIPTEVNSMMILGKQKHHEIDKLHHKEYWISEPGKTVRIENGNESWLLHGHVDLVHRKVKVIREIKPKYSKRAYMQTLLYKLLYPDCIVQCLEYVTGKIFDLQADYNMALVYFMRMVHATDIIPPRLPNFPSSLCHSCSYLQRCLNIPDYSWAEFTEHVTKRTKGLSVSQVADSSE